MQWFFLLRRMQIRKRLCVLLKRGATDFIPKPWEKEKLLATLSAALKLRESRTEINTLKQRVEALGSPDDTGFEIIGESDVMQELFATIAKLKDTDANILILGENGTGKDLIARALYHHSPRSGCNQVFISIDLGSIPEQLFESELFGYEKGAFTDARRDKPGRMEVASGGTLFLDEIGNLSLPMQAKLLTAIEKRQILRLGATRSVPIDVRLISATNMDIHAMVQEGTFRQDLLYRINTIELHIPPLRERGNDILLLADYFLDCYARKYKKKIGGLTRDAKTKLQSYAWPGNVRELQHAIERAVICGAAHSIVGGALHRRILAVLLRIMVQHSDCGHPADRYRRSSLFHPDEIGRYDETTDRLHPLQ